MIPFCRDRVMRSDKNNKYRKYGSKDRAQHSIKKKRGKKTGSYSYQTK